MDHDGMGNQRCPQTAIFAFRHLMSLMSTGAIIGIGLMLSVEIAHAVPTSPAVVDPDAGASDGTIEAVIVTARRKSENAQDVPISMTVVTENVLDQNGIANSLGLNEVIPSLQVFSYNPRNTNFIIRGLGSNISISNDGVESGVGVYVDGVFYPRPAESTFDMPDLLSVEELRGPQGTLYGKNATAGVINITTQAPSFDPEARGEITFGDFAYLHNAGTISGPINDKLTARFSFVDTFRNGFIRNVTTGTLDEDFRDYGLRGQLLFEPSETLSVRMIVDYSHQHQRCCITLIDTVVTILDDGAALPRNFFQRAAQADYTPLPIAPFDRVTDANSPYYAIMEQGGLSVQADQEFGSYTLTSISAFRFWNWNPSNDTDLTALSVFDENRQANQEHDVTQEFRISSPGDQAVEFSGGLFYFWEQDDGYGITTYGTDAPIWILGSASSVNQAALGNFSIASKSVPRINSYAVFGQAAWHLMPSLDLTGGLRYTYEYKTGGYSQIQLARADLSTFPASIAAAAQVVRNSFGTNGSYSVHTSNDLLGGLASITYRPSDRARLYATYSHGSKSSGMNLLNLPTGAPRTVAPEEIDAFEAGIKSTWLGSRVLLNADMFLEKDGNYQTTILTTTPPVIQLAGNITGVRSRGMEADLDFKPFANLSTRFSAAYTDAVYASYPNAPCALENFVVINGVLNPNVTCNLSGRPLPAVSKWVISAGGEYDQPLSELGWGDLLGYLGGDASYRSAYYSTVNDSQYSLVAGYSVFNLRVGLRSPDARWDLSIWARNALNTDYVVASTPVSFNSGAFSAQLGDPRTVGVTLRLAFI